MNEYLNLNLMRAMLYWHKKLFLLVSAIGAGNALAKIFVDKFGQK